MRPVPRGIQGAPNHEDGPMGPEVDGVYGVYPAAAVDVLRRHVLRDEPHRNLHEHGGAVNTDDLRTATIC